jgi:hypothetical protein
MYQEVNSLYNKYVHSITFVICPSSSKQSRLISSTVILGWQSGLQPLYEEPQLLGSS